MINDWQSYVLQFQFILSGLTVCVFDCDCGQHCKKNLHCTFFLIIFYRCRTWMIRLFVCLHTVIVCLLLFIAFSITWPLNEMNDIWMMVDRDDYDRRTSLLFLFAAARLMWKLMKCFIHCHVNTHWIISTLIQSAI